MSQTHQPPCLRAYKWNIQAHCHINIVTYTLEASLSALAPISQPVARLYQPLTGQSRVAYIQTRLYHPWPFYVINYVVVKTWDKSVSKVTAETRYLLNFETPFVFTLRTLVLFSWAFDISTASVQCRLKRRRKLSYVMWRQKVSTIHIKAQT